MRIGEVARKTGVKAETIRFYERVGILTAPSRTRSNYRDYGPAEAARLIFIRRARDLGFSLEQIGQLLSLWDDPERASADVKRLAQTHIADLDARIAALTDMRATLVTLVRACHGDHRPDCPILQGLAAPR